MDTKQDDLVSNYIAKLEKENKELAKRPEKSFEMSTLAAETLGGWLMGLLCVGSVITWFGAMLLNHGPTGEYYVEYKDTKIVTPVTKEQCIVNDITYEPCYYIMSEYNWGGDDSASLCFKTSEEAHEKAKQLAEEYKQRSEE